MSAAKYTAKIVPADGGGEVVGEDGESSTFEAAKAVFAYMTCSATLLVINKVAVTRMPSPTMIVTVQLAFSAGVVLFGGVLGFFQDAEPLQWAMMKKWGPLAAVFSGALFLNTTALSKVNMETVIVFRSATPLAVAFLDYFFNDYDFPTMSSIGALSLIFFGAWLYFLDEWSRLDELTAEEQSTTITGYFWCISYFMWMCFDMTYIKHFLTKVPMSTSGRVLYQNAISVPMTFGVALINSEVVPFALNDFDAVDHTVLFMSCVIGFGISMAAWKCRALTSATTFTVLGVLCKVLSEFINFTIWDKHATPFGIGSLGLCIVGAYLYTPAKANPKNRETAALH